MISLFSFLFENSSGPTTPFDLKKFKALTNLDSRLKYLYSIDAEDLGEGVDRRVFDIGNGKAIKLLISDDDSQQRYEVRASKCFSSSKLFTHVLAHAKDYSWIIVEKADSLFNDFPAAESTLMKRISVKLGFVDAGVPSELKLRFSYELSHLIKEALGQFSGKHLAKTRLDYLKDHPSPWFNELIRLVGKCSVSPEDFHPGNFGIKDGELVIIDYGFEQDM